MATEINKKEIAKSLYLEGNYTQEEIADKVGCTRQTIARWAKQGAWEEIKASITITPDKIIKQWQRQIIEINNNIAARTEGHRYATPPEADSLGKLAAAVKKLQMEIRVEDCVSVAMRFLSWLRPLDIDAAKQFSLLFDAFIKDQATKKG